MPNLINWSVIFTLSLLITNTLSAQTPKGLSVELDKESQSLLVQKSGNDVTEDYEIQALELDVYDASSGEYSGTLDLDTWNIPLSDFTENDIIMVASVKMIHKESGMDFVMNPETKIYPKE